MSKCRDQETILGCFTPDDGSEPESVAVVHVFDSAGAIIATYYYDASDNVIDVDTYRGGGVVTLGACVKVIVDYLYIEGCWSEDAVPTNSKVVISVYEKGFPMIFIGHLEEDGVTVADVTGWTKTDDCKCG